MLQALLRGKLSSQQENSEDLLTSAVFGLVSYLPADQGLWPLLSLSRFADGTPDALFHNSGLNEPDMKFWPLAFLEQTGWTEPDVLIEVMDGSGRRHLILIEVKLRSEKSGRPDFDSSKLRDQLAREWMILVDLCKAKQAMPHLIYVTSDLGFPKDDIQESALELAVKAAGCVDQFPFHCGWIPWFLVIETFRSSTSTVLRDIAAACGRLNLSRFLGITPIEPKHVAWSFATGQETYQFNLDPMPSLWSFK